MRPFVEGLYVESEKYIIREMNEKDFDDVKVLLQENEYLNMIWGIPYRSQERLDEFIKCIFMVNAYCVMEKKSGVFCGYMSIMTENKGGEISVRMRNNVNLYEVLEILGWVLKQIGPTEQKNFSMQYCFE